MKILKKPSTEEELCSSFLLPPALFQHCLMHVIDSLWFFWGRDSWITSCSSSGDHLELTVCSPDPYLPLPSQPGNHQAPVFTVCAQQVCLVRDQGTQAECPPHQVSNKTRSKLSGCISREKGTRHNCRDLKDNVGHFCVLLWIFSSLLPLSKSGFSIHAC